MSLNKLHNCYRDNIKHNNTIYLGTCGHRQNNHSIRMQLKNCIRHLKKPVSICYVPIIFKLIEIAL